MGKEDTKPMSSVVDLAFESWYRQEHPDLLGDDFKGELRECFHYAWEQALRVKQKEHDENF